MNSRSFFAVFAAATALLGISALTALGGAEAQTAITPVWPKALVCEKGQTYRLVRHGTDDNFSTTGTADGLPAPSAAQAAAFGLSAPSNIYDSTKTDYHFGDTLAYTLASGESVGTARLTTRLKANGGQWNNDGIHFSQTGGTAPVVTPISFATPQLSTLKSYDFTASAAALTHNPWLDVYMQDDSSIDFLGLELCIVQPPPYDVGVKKAQTHGGYAFTAYNGARPLPAGAKIEVTEVVPSGLTIAAVGAPSPWTCTLPVTPLVGPDSFVCTYIVPSPGLAANTALPTVEMKASGDLGCPNCVRVRLYLPYRPLPEGERDGAPGLPIHYELVKEQNTDNNVACAK